MTYREAEAAESIIVCMGKSLVALDHETGKIRWCAVGEYIIERMFRLGDNILAVGGRGVLCVHAATGAIVGRVPLDFQTENALVCGEDLVIVATASSSLTGQTRILSLAPDGSVRWRVTSTFESTGFLSANTLLQAVDPHGGITSETRFPVSSYNCAGIAFGNDVAQPDQIGRE